LAGIENTLLWAGVLILLAGPAALLVPSIRRLKTDDEPERLSTRT
jgi:hypothetical protein